MTIRQRAIQQSDKAQRRHAILDAAERLLAGSPERLPSVAAVAAEAGLAKGTVYLYFPSKEELLLAVHERNLDAYFGALGRLLDAAAPVTLDDLLAVTAERVVRVPLFLPLAARCFALMAQSIPPPAAAAFRQRMAARLERAAAGLERRFPRLQPGEGLALLRHSFALMIGLWQMAIAAGGAARPGLPSRAPLSPVYGWSYADELARALASLWQAATGAPPSSPGG